jgi:hypothetical protein
MPRLRELGQTRGALAKAFERLVKRGRPSPKLYPNQSARELRQHYLRTTPPDRLKETADLSRVLTSLATRGAAASEAGRNLGRMSRGEGELPALDFYGLLRELCEHDVEFVLVGGFALGFHGGPRGTKGVDIVPDPSPANIARLWEALQELDARPSEHGDFRLEEMPVPFTLEGLLEGGNWSLETRRGRLDVMQWVAGVEGYDELRARAVSDEPPQIGRPIWIAGRDDLVTMKEEAGRPQDLIDIRALMMAEGLEE